MGPLKFLRLLAELVFVAIFMIFCAEIFVSFFSMLATVADETVRKHMGHHGAPRWLQSLVLLVLSGLWLALVVRRGKKTSRFWLALSAVTFITVTLDVFAHPFATRIHLF